MAGIKELFNPFPRNTSVWDRVDITVKRHERNYFLNYSQEQLEEIPLAWRPRVVVTKELYDDCVKKNERARNKKLAFVIDNNVDWAQRFKEKLKNGTIPNLTKAKDEAADLWARHSADYDKARAVQTPSASGHGHTVDRKRINYDTDAEYRRDLRRKRSQAKQNKAHKMAMTASVQDMDEDFRYVLDLPSGGLYRCWREHEDVIEYIMGRPVAPPTSANGIRVHLLQVAALGKLIDHELED